MVPPAPNVAVAKPELAFLHQVLGLNLQALPTELKNVVFICVDCEAFEHDQSKVTELGVAALDTRDIWGSTPEENGEGWIAKMKYAHFRPVEYARHVNRKFVKGCEDKFAFGKTTWIHLRDSAKLLSRIFQCPERISEAASFDTDLPNSRRNVVFVAHGISNDDAYLAQLGFTLSNVSNVIRQVDSQRVAGGTKKRGIGLKGLLQKLGMQSQGLHNAGNDAAYTLQALILMAVKEYQQPGLIFAASDLPATSLPGVVSRPNISAPHVYGGTAVEGKDKLPVDGGKLTSKVKVKGSFKRKSPTLGRSFATASLPNLGRHVVKRSAPSEEEEHEQQAKKRQAR